jgi:hypothetical protein
MCPNQELDENACTRPSCTLTSVLASAKQARATFEACNPHMISHNQYIISAWGSRVGANSQQLQTRYNHTSWNLAALACQGPRPSQPQLSCPLQPAHLPRPKFATFKILTPRCNSINTTSRQLYGTHELLGNIVLLTQLTLQLVHYANTVWVHGDDILPLTGAVSDPLAAVHQHEPPCARPSCLRTCSP